MYICSTLTKKEDITALVQVCLIQIWALTIKGSLDIQPGERNSFYSGGFLQIVFCSEDLKVKVCVGSAEM